MLFEEIPQGELACAYICLMRILHVSSDDNEKLRNNVEHFYKMLENSLGEKTVDTIKEKYKERTKDES